MQLKPEKNLILYNFLYTIFKRQWLILIVTGVTFFLVIFGTWMTAPTWDGVCKVLVRAMSQQQLSLFEDLSVPMRDNASVNPGSNLVQILYSRNLAEEVVTKFELDEKLRRQKEEPEQLRQKIKNGIIGVITSPLALAKALGILEGKTTNWTEEAIEAFMEDQQKSELEEATQVITVAVEETDPVLASKISRFMAEQLVTRAAEMDRKSSTAAQEFAKTELNTAEKDLKAAEEALLQFTENENIINLDAEKQAKLNQIARIDEEYSQAAASLAEAQAKLEGLEQQIEQQRSLLTPSTMVPSSPTIARLKENLNDLQSNLAGAQAKIKELEEQIAHQRGVLSPSMVVSNNPAVAELKQNLSDLESALAGAMQNYQPGSKTVKKLQAQVDGTTEQLKVEMSEILKSEISVLNTIHPNLPNNFVETMTLVMSLESQITVTQDALQQEMNEILSSEVAVLNTIHANLPKDYVDTITRVMATRAREQVLAGQLEQFRTEAQALTVKGMELERLDRTVAANRELYNNLLSKYTQLKVQSATVFAGFDLQIIDTANLPEDAEQDQPVWLLNIALGLIASAILGLGAAFFCEYWVENFRVPKDVEHRVGLQVLCTIPDVPANKIFI